MKAQILRVDRHATRKGLSVRVWIRMPSGNLKVNESERKGNFVRTLTLLKGRKEMDKHTQALYDWILQDIALCLEVKALLNEVSPNEAAIRLRHDFKQQLKGCNFMAFCYNKVDYMALVEKLSRRS